MTENCKLECSLDDLGRYAIISIDTKVFSELSVMKTAYWFTNEYFLYLYRGTNGTEGNLFVEFRLKEPTENDRIQLENACREFSNRLIDQVVRQSILTETSAVRDTLVKKAFFEGRLRTNLTNDDK